MARDSVRPFIVGLLFVYLLDIRRSAGWPAAAFAASLAILVVYVVAIVVIVEFLSLTLTPLVNEILRFIADFPTLAESRTQLQKLSEFYARSRSRSRSATGSTASSPGSGRAATVGPGSTCPSCCRSSPAPAA